MSKTIRTADRRTTPPPATSSRTQRRFSVAEYHRLIDAGILREDERCELIQGWILELMPPNPPHAKAMKRVNRTLTPLFAWGEWVVGVQDPVTLADDEPLPDFSVATGPDSKYDTRHPGPRDLVLIVEISDSSLDYDRGEKLAMYAEAKIPVYWIVNLIDRQVEVYTHPRGGRNPTYRTRVEYSPGQDVTVVVGGRAIGTIPAGDILP
jgi:Uma2 family endonuclease